MDIARHKWTITAVLALLALAAIGLRLHAHAQDTAPEVVLALGEPWENVRKNSSAEVHAIFGPEIGSSWFRVIPGDARMRFVDPQYGFVTPRAKFFTVGFDEATKVTDVRMSPQVETLPLDDALKIVLDLQDQWRRGGWTPINNIHRHPSYADTPQWRQNIKACKPDTTYWQVPGLYQTQLFIACFEDSKYPNQDRYLITLEVSRPYEEQDDGIAPRRLHPFNPPGQ